MKHARRQLSEVTIADMYRAMDRKRPVTITYLKDEKDAAGKPTGRLVETVRTIEPYDIRTTSKGAVIVKAMDRGTAESRTFRVDRIETYTLHAGTYQVPRPADDKPAVLPRTVAALTAYEIGRDDRRYWVTREYPEPVTAEAA